MCLRFNKGSGGPKGSAEENRKNAEIDKIIRRDKKQQARNVKILLLGELHIPTGAERAGNFAEQGPGAGESGKSTILKQMRLIYTEGFGLHERKEVRQVIFANMIVAFKIIGEEMRDLGMNYELKESAVSCIAMSFTFSADVTIEI